MLERIAAVDHRQGLRPLADPPAFKFVGPTLVCLAWNDGIKDATLKRLRELDEAKEKPFFICLERSLTTTSKWNLNHRLGKRLTAF